MTGAPLLDLVLCLVLVGTGAATVLVRDALDSAILFGTFSLVMAVAWIRLGAPDLALVEAMLELIVILFIGALGLLRAIHGPERLDHEGTRGTRRGVALIALPLLAVFVAAAAASEVAGGPAALSPLVRSEVHASGVENPVTAVLLNFRAFDTLLEVAVLLLAVTGAMFLQPHARVEPETDLVDVSEHGMPALAWFAARVAPVGVLFAFFLWHAGSSKAGGAFQAGALLAGIAGVLLMARLMPQPDTSLWWVRALPAAGLTVFALVGTAMLAIGNRFLEYPPGLAHGLIIGVEAVLSISIGACLTGLVADISARARAR